MVWRAQDLYDGEKAREEGAPAPRPLHLYGYGSYGICIDPGFNRTVLPYLDRGMIFVIAHIRGGGEMGRYWYEEQGKYLQKRNTFSVPTTARPVSCLHVMLSLCKDSIGSDRSEQSDGKLFGGRISSRARSTWWRRATPHRRPCHARGAPPAVC